MRARRNEFLGEQDGALRVSVTQSPERGKANKAIVELFAAHDLDEMNRGRTLFGLRPRRVSSRYWREW